MKITSKKQLNQLIEEQKEMILKENLGIALEKLSNEIQNDEAKGLISKLMKSSNNTLKITAAIIKSANSQEEAKEIQIALVHVFKEIELRTNVLLHNLTIKFKESSITKAPPPPKMEDHKKHINKLVGAGESKKTVKESTSPGPGKVANIVHGVTLDPKDRAILQKHRKYMHFFKGTAGNYSNAPDYQPASLRAARNHSTAMQKLHAKYTAEHGNDHPLTKAVGKRAKEANKMHAEMKQMFGGE